MGGKCCKNNQEDDIKFMDINATQNLLNNTIPAVRETMNTLHSKKNV